MVSNILLGFGFDFTLLKLRSYAFLTEDIRLVGDKQKLHCSPRRRKSMALCVCSSSSCVPRPTEVAGLDGSPYVQWIVKNIRESPLFITSTKQTCSLSWREPLPHPLVSCSNLRPLENWRSKSRLTESMRAHDLCELPHFSVIVTFVLLPVF